MSTAIIALMVICCCSSSGTGAMFGLGYIPQTEPHYMRVTGLKDLMQLSDKIKNSGNQDDCPKLHQKLTKVLKKQNDYGEDLGGFYTHDFGFVNLEPGDDEDARENLNEYMQERDHHKFLINDDGTPVCPAPGA